MKGNCPFCRNKLQLKAEELYCSECGYSFIITE